MPKIRRKDIDAAMRRAKDLESREPMPKEEVVGVYKEGISTLDSLKRLLKRVWFIRDTDKPRARPMGKSASPRAKRR